MKTVHYEVSGMTGSLSKTQLLNSLDKIEGIQGVAVDLSRGTVEVDYNEPADSQQIQDCIRKTGFDIR
jgi:Copper chaperone